MSPVNDFPEEKVITRQKEDVKLPKRYKVLLHNDDYTTMDFVVLVLMRFFHKSETEALHIMLNVHKKGVGVAGIYPLEIAETKVNHVHNMARSNNHPLKCSIEKE
jgi:ATP-dependent Clp protease adaptor protein ClpS